MKKLFTYLKPYWKSVLAAPLLMLIEVMTELFLPVLMARIVDQGIGEGDIPLIIKTGLMMIGLAFIGLAGGFGCNVFSSVAAQSFGTDLRSDLFRKVQSFSFASLDKFETGSLITRLTNDVVQLQTFVMMLLRIMVKAPLLFMGGIIMAVVVNPGLSLILVAAVPFLAAALFYVMRKGIPLYTEVQKALDRVNEVVRENLAGIRVVKAFVRADFENQRFDKVNLQLMDSGVQAARVMGMIMPVMMLILNMSILAVLWFGGMRINQGNMLVGQVMAFINYMTQILFSLMIAGFMLMTVSRAKVSGDRIEEVLSTETEIRDQLNPSMRPIQKGRVDFDHVSFRYEKGGGEPVLKDLSFTALPGQRLAILGSTGSGKTTLVNLIARFYDATSGRVLVDGRDVREIKLDVLRQGIGMVPQQSLLFSGSVWENIRWGREDASDAEVMEASQAAQAHEFILALPKGYNTILGQRGVNLSGGQKQRIALARALIKKPSLLILDDSTSAVDVVTETLIQESIKAVMKETTSIVIAQRISAVLDADKIMVLEDGQIIAAGSHSYLIGCCPVYQDIYNSQMGREEIAK